MSLCHGNSWQVNESRRLNAGWFWLEGLAECSKPVVCLVHLVCLVDLVYLVSFVQPKTRQTKQTKATNRFSPFTNDEDSPLRSMVMKKNAFGVIGYSVLLLAVLAALGIGWGLQSQSFAEDATDLYFKTPGTPQGPPAPSPQETVYSGIGSFDSRLLVWFVTQLHTYFGGLVLALPIFCVLLEFLGLSSRNPARALRYDGLARDLAKVGLLALSVTSVVGSLMLGTFLYFYPSFMMYMGGTFKDFMPVYAIVFVGESLLLGTYYYSWNRMTEPALKWAHASIGLLANVFGTALLLLANAWSAFMMAPAGVDAQGRFLGNGWHLLHSALWNPLNVHRFLANIMSGGAVVLAYACYRFFTSKTEEERAYFDWVGHIFLFVTVCALLPMPFAGYWLMRSVYAFSQSMGVTMMGGFLSWLWILQALLIAVIFLSANYYLWIGMGRIEGGQRYAGHIKWLLAILTVCVLVWATPHNPVVTPTEQALIGGAFHPLLGVLGVMSAKNTAVNIMILTTFLSFLFYRRAGKGDPLPFATQGRSARIALVVVAGICVLLAVSPALAVFREGLTEFSRVARVGLMVLHGLVIVAATVLTFRDRGKFGQWLILGSAAFVVVFFGVYGYFVEATIRIGFSVYQVLAVLTALIAVTAIDVFLYRGAPSLGAIQWGRMPVRAQYILILLAVTFTWLMGLMGYARNAIRQHWHVYQVVQDTSPDAFSPTLGFAALVISVCVLLFLALIGFIFWLGRLGEQKAAVESPPAEAQVVSAPGALEPGPALASTK